mmetsp:Transcript_59637/g.166517  ORF Transcript_59637/g.166517 Transcript_59637/m.166517 type:complete len:204 (+) Transcript_59637:400-1011(+)
MLRVAGEREHPELTARHQHLPHVDDVGHQRQRALQCPEFRAFGQAGANRAHQLSVRDLHDAQFRATQQHLPQGLRLWRTRDYALPHVREGPVADGAAAPTGRKKRLPHVGARPGRRSSPKRLRRSCVGLHHLRRRGFHGHAVRARRAPPTPTNACSVHRWAVLQNAFRQLARALQFTAPPHVGRTHLPPSLARERGGAVLGHV